MLMIIFLSLVTTTIYAANDKLIIVSPHRKSVQREFIPLFKKDYQARYKKSIDVDWLDQGGTTDNMRFVKAKFAKNPNSAGIDVFFGGGDLIFTLMEQDNLLSPYQLSDELRRQLPRTVAGIAIASKTNVWYSAALSSFGIFYNKKLLALEKLPTIKTWSDLARPQFYNHVSVVDPRRSGGMSAMVEIILQSMGWDEGWRLLAGLAANTRKFTHSSSDPIKTVVAGDAVAALAIDFYAYSRINSIGSDKLGFVMPKGQTILNGDPVGILRGAPNRLQAERFLEFILRADVQKRLILPKGAPDGPKYSYLGRLAVNPFSYRGSKADVLNPHTMQTKDFIELDHSKSVKAMVVRKALIGAIHVDPHKELRRAWQLATKRNKQKLLDQLSRPPVTESQFFKLTDKWDDAVFRNQQINSWLKSARQKYQHLTKLAQAK